MLPGMLRSHRLMQEIGHTPLIDRVPRLPVPVHLMIGVHDSLTPPGHAREFHDRVLAPTRS